MGTADGPIRIHRFDEARLRRAEIRPGTERQLVAWNDFIIDEPECFAGFQELRPGDPLDYWVMWFDEVQYALSGQARLVYRMAPRFAQEFSVDLSAGDLYKLPVGCDFRWEVLGDEPFRTLIVALPRLRSMT